MRLFYPPYPTLPSPTASRIYPPPPPPPPPPNKAFFFPHAVISPETLSSFPLASPPGWPRYTSARRHPPNRPSGLLFFFPADLAAFNTGSASIVQCPPPFFPFPFFHANLTFFVRKSKRPVPSRACKCRPVLRPTPGLTLFFFPLVSRQFLNGSLSPSPGLPLFLPTTYFLSPLPHPLPVSR